MKKQSSSNPSQERLVETHNINNPDEIEFKQNFQIGTTETMNEELTRPLSSGSPRNNLAYPDFVAEQIDPSRESLPQLKGQMVIESEESVDRQLHSSK